MRKDIKTEEAQLLINRVREAMDASPPPNPDRFIAGSDINVADWLATIMIQREGIDSQLEENSNGQGLNLQPLTVGCRVMQYKSALKILTSIVVRISISTRPLCRCFYKDIFDNRMEVVSVRTAVLFL